MASAVNQLRGKTESDVCFVSGKLNNEKRVGKKSHAKKQGKKLSGSDSTLKKCKVKKRKIGFENPAGNNVVKPQKN